MSTRSGKTLGVGLVGVGRHGTRYLQHLLHDLPDVSLSAICRRNVSAPPPCSNVTVYDDYRAMVSDERVQAVVVVTPPSLCRDICLAAISCGKPVLIEKPLATTGVDARAMVNAAEQAGVLLMTAQTMRFDPAIIRLSQELPCIGRLRKARLVSHIETRANLLPGTEQAIPLGALLEIGVHLLDLVRFVTREEIQTVQCTMAPLPPAAPESRAKVSLRTTSGISCLLDIARVDAKRVGTATWIGTKGTLKADWVARRVTNTLRDGTSQEWMVEPQPTVLATLRAFVQAIETNSPPLITGLDGCRAVEAADACYCSARQGSAVVPVIPCA